MANQNPYPIEVWELLWYLTGLFDACDEDAEAPDLFRIIDCASNKVRNLINSVEGVE